MLKILALYEGNGRKLILIAIMMAMKVKVNLMTSPVYFKQELKRLEKKHEKVDNIQSF